MALHLTNAKRGWKKGVVMEAPGKVNLKSDGGAEGWDLGKHDRRKKRGKGICYT